MNTCQASNGLFPERQKSILLASRHERDGCWSSILQIWLNYWDEKLPSCRGVNCLYVRRKAPILWPTFLQIESTWGDQERLSSMIIPRRRVCETSLTSSFCSKSRTPVGRPWHAREWGAMTMATVLETLIDRPRSARAREVSFSAAETELQARAADVCEQYRVMSSANDGILIGSMLPCKWWQVCHINVKQQWSKDTALGDPLVAREERRRLVVDHYPLLPIVKKISEPAKSCAANATGLQSQEQVLMQNIVECLWQVNEDSGCVLILVTSLEPVIESCKEEIWARVRSSESELKLAEQLSVWQKRRNFVEHDFFPEPWKEEVSRKFPGNFLVPLRPSFQI